MNYKSKIQRKWMKFWMRVAMVNKASKVASWMACLFSPGYKGSVALANMTRRGFVSPFATINHNDVQFGDHVFIDKNVVVFKAGGGGHVELDDEVRVIRGSILETGQSGNIRVGKKTWIHPNCHLFAYLNDIIIGEKVLIAANTALYPHNHGVMGTGPIMDLPCISKGPIHIGDGSWLGTGVSVLGGVSIGPGAVIGAGAVVTKDIPQNAIAFGVPAKVARMRKDLGNVK